MKNYPNILMHGSGAAIPIDPTRLLLIIDQSQLACWQELEAILTEIGLEVERRELDELQFPVADVPCRQRIILHDMEHLPVDQELIESIKNSWNWNLLPVYRLPDAPEDDSLICPFPLQLTIANS